MSGFQSPWSNNSQSPSGSGFQSPWSNAPQNSPQNTPQSFTSLAASDFNGRIAPGSIAAAPGAPSPGGGGFFQNMWSGIMNGYDYTKGALSGVGNALTGNNDPTQQQGTGRLNQVVGDLTHPGQMLQHNWQALKNIPEALFGGLTHPAEATQQFEQGVKQDSTVLPPGIKQLFQYGIGSANDPMMYAPLGKAAQLIKAGADAAHITPLVTKAADAVKASKVVQNPLVQGAKDAIGSKFIKHYGADDMVKSGLKDLQGARSSDAHHIVQSMTDMAKVHGLSKDEMTQLVHHFEGDLSTNPKVIQAHNDLSDLLVNGIHTPNGRALGTNAELSTMFKDNPILQGTRENYYPHRYNNKPAEVQAALQKSGKPGYSVNGPFNQERSFDTVKVAMAHGLSPEMNPYAAIGQRLYESSKALRNAHMLNGLMDSGVVSKDGAAGMKESSIPQLRGMSIHPDNEAALKQALEPAVKDTLYDKALGKWKQFSVMNSLVHGHNIGYNGMYLGGANPSYVGETVKNLFQGKPDEWYQRALQSGAVSADRGKFMDNLKSSLDHVASPIKDKVSYAFHGALWDADKGMRTAIFRQAVEGGASDAEAAAKANKFLIDYNNLTPFETKVMTRIFPFYTWMKGNIPLQAEQWINNTPKQQLYEIAKNSISQGLSGNDTHEGKIDTGIKLSDGSHLMIDPYAPADEPLKIAREGVIPFLYGRVNPLLKEGMDQLTNHAYYPGTTVAPHGKESMATQEIRTQGAPWDYNAGKSVAHAVNNLNPVGGGAVGSVAELPNIVNKLFGVPTKDRPATTGTEVATRLLGGFPSRFNPEKDAYYQQKNQQDSMKGRMKYLKDTGQPIPKSLKRSAYKKIPLTK